RSGRPSTSCRTTGLARRRLPEGPLVNSIAAFFSHGYGAGANELRAMQPCGGFTLSAVIMRRAAKEFRGKRLLLDRHHAHHPAREARRRYGDRETVRAHFRAGPLCAQRLSAARRGPAPARAFVHGADRHAARRLGAAHADPDRENEGAAAGAAHGRAAVPLE